jgi:hypothetical protein
MTINKLSEFARDGDKSISGLTLTAGFPLRQKPFRQWFNWIFNEITKKTNELVVDVNANSQSVIDNANDIVNLDAKVLPLFEPIEVGELFMTTKDYQSPQDVMVRHGYGTWERYAEGRTLVGYSNKSSDPSSYKTMGNEFGENEHQLTVAEMPSHSHENKIRGSGGGANTNPYEAYKGAASANDHYGLYEGGITIEKTGGDQPHNNIQPSIVAAYWLRIA